MSTNEMIAVSPVAETVEFTEVPEFESHDAESVIDLVENHYLREGNSFGAFILRNVEYGTMDEIEESFKDNPTLCSNRTYRYRQFSNHISTLHTDPGVEGEVKNNDVTLHFTFKGSGEFILLAGSRIYKPSNPFLFTDPVLLRQNIKMFDSERFTSEFASTPETAYRTELDMCDLLIFDHTQPHAFRSDRNTSRRASIAHYFTDNE